MGWDKGQSVEWVLDQDAQPVLQSQRPEPPGLTDTGPTPLLDRLQELIGCAQAAFGKLKGFQRSARHLLSQLVWPGRHTITGLVCCQNRQHQDWTADYRHYARGRAQPEAFFRVAQQCIEQHLAPGQPLVAALDDSLERKTGRKTYGVSYLRDPLSPPFHTNLVRGARLLQLSAAWPYGQGQARMIPIAFQLAPLPAKPSPKAEPPVWEAYKKARARANINVVASQRVSQFYQSRPPDQAVAHPLSLVVDGRLTNGTFLKGLPASVTLIGRVRKDSTLFHPPELSTGKGGRKRRYGARAPTPEALREDPAVPWTQVEVHFAGRWLTCSCKQLKPLLSKLNGGQKPVQLVVIASLNYYTPSGKHLCRKPAYLLCDEVHLPVEQVLQRYCWRWDIEVNLRDEKTPLGVGQAQVRSPRSTEQAPALAVAAYALLLIASLQTYGPEGQPEGIPLPKWRRSKPPRRATTNRLINQLRLELWADSIERRSFSGFPNNTSPEQKPQKWKPDLFPNVFYVAQ
jgi:hypothetical protein